MNSTQKRSREEKRAAFEAEMIEQAPKMLELAENALQAVQAMMALEAEMKEKNGDECTVFSCEDDKTLLDAENAISAARLQAMEYMKRIKKAKNDA